MGRKRTNTAAVEKIEQPRSLSIASKGVRTAGDFADMMSALMCDLIEGRVTPQVGNATCNAGGKLLRVVELQAKYGTATPGEPRKLLSLALNQEGVGQSAN